MALAALLRRRWRRFLVAGAAAVDGDDVVEVEAEAGGGAASSNSITSWAVAAFPPLDERVRVADLLTCQSSSRDGTSQAEKLARLPFCAQNLNN